MTSTVADQGNDRFRVKAVAVGRDGSFGVRRQSTVATPLSSGCAGVRVSSKSQSDVALRFPPQPMMLEVSGAVSVENQTVRFKCADLVEESSVSVDGVRQDFQVQEKPGGAGVPANRFGRIASPHQRTGIYRAAD